MNNKNNKNDKNDNKIITELTDEQINDLLTYTPPYSDENAANIKSLALKKIKTRKPHKPYYRRILIAVAVMLFAAIGVGATYYVGEIVITKINGVISESMDYKFILDEKAVGVWDAVDFVKNINDFKAGQKSWKNQFGREAENLYWLKVMLYDDGTILSAYDSDFIVTSQWTKGYIVEWNVIPAYTIKKIDGSEYMFVQWKSGDYTYQGMKPWYYVFIKTSSDLPNREEYLAENLNRHFEERKNDVPNITVSVRHGRLYDIMDNYDFVIDEKAVGTWESVDFVNKVDDFKAGEKQWKHSNLFWVNNVFYDDGSVLTTFDTGVSGRTFALTGVMRTITRKWTKGCIVMGETIPAYVIKNIDGTDYMFIQWKSGDYTIRGMEPSYYVFAKVTED